MANIKKSFNFRNGVQVDDDNFIINPNGLVGIGSTIPTESLDVQGNIRLRGILYADGVASNSILNTSSSGSVNFNLVNVGITSIKSGIITASSGIVTYYGDGSNLQGLPTSQWVDVDPTLNGYTSIYSVGNVGIATTNPIYTLQIGGNYSLESFINGVGISSQGDIKATRDITIGRNLNVTGIATISSYLNVTGVTTSYSFSGFGTDITGINASNISNGTLNNDRLPTNINKPTGIATFNVFNGSLVGIATTARGLTTDANIDIISIVSDRSDLGLTTSSSLNVTNSLGVGTNNPNSDIHIRRIGSNAELQITSDSNIAQFILGKDITLTNKNTVLQFNDISIFSHPQSGEDSFDIINYAPGNFNSFIRPESTPNLKFNWINRSTNAILMSLTSGGNLGLGKTNPSLTFEVVGTSTITSNSFVGGDFSVSGSVTGSSLTINGSSTLRTTTINGTVGIFANSPNYTLQVGSTLSALGTSGTGVGISSSGNVVASGIITASKFVGIGSNLTLLNPSNIGSGTINNVSINSPSGVVTTSIVDADYVSGIGSNITNLTPENINSGTITNININSINGIITTSTLDADYLFGNGDNITSLPASSITSGTISNVNINSPAGVVTVGVLSASSLYGNGDNITSLSASAITSGTLSNVDINSPAGIVTVGVLTASSLYGTLSANNVNTGSFLGDSYNFVNGSVAIGTVNAFGSALRINDVYVDSGIGTFIASSGITTFIDEVDNTSFMFGKYILYFEYPGYVQVENVTLLYNNSVGVMYTTYGSINNPSKIVEISTSIDNEEGFSRLDVTPQSGINGLTTYRFHRELTHNSNII